MTAEEIDAVKKAIILLFDMGLINRPEKYNISRKAAAKMIREVKNRVEKAELERHNNTYVIKLDKWPSSQAREV